MQPDSWANRINRAHERQRLPMKPHPGSPPVAGEHRNPMVRRTTFGDPFQTSAE
jgi:hypothetical protein